MSRPTGGQEDDANANMDVEDADSSTGASYSSPFVTTSDVMNQLNKQLSSLSSPEDDAHMKPRFELQKRLPDGSAIPASTEEIAAADFKTKLEQSAAFVAQLATTRDRQYWAEQQRQLGNAFFQQGDYKGAMDIYLSCLLVKEESNTSITPETWFVNETLLPILNNLAQCTSQLGMHKKTVVFCDMAIDEATRAEKLHQQHEATGPTNTVEDQDAAADIGPSVDDHVVDSLALCKIHFKKAKALRLTGHYLPSRMSLTASLKHLEAKEKERSSISAHDPDTATGNTMVLTPYQQAIQKEFKHLDTAEKEARKNRQRQKSAMQRAMSSSEAAAVAAGTEPRQFSKLRARKTSRLDDTRSASSSSQPPQQNYMEYYLNLVARVAQYLLHMIGDDEAVDKDKDKKEM